MMVLRWIIIVDMNLLPKNYSDFKEKAYWDSFFSKLKAKGAFEWYGAFQNYRDNIFFVLMQLSQLNKGKAFTVANVGCGNSTLADDIVNAYPLFSIAVDSLDYSEQVIAEMRAKNGKKEQLTYQVCDMLKPVPAELVGRYDVVVDKGTLDAILPEGSEQNMGEIEAVYFANIKKMLRTDKHSSYIIITMLQSFILETVLRSFAHDKHFAIKIHERWIPDSEVQPFLIEIRHSPLPSQKEINVELLLLNKTVIVPKDIPSAMEEVLRLQKLNSYTGQVRELRASQHSTFNVFAQHNQAHRYVIDIFDHADPAVLKKNSCAVFIVPQGQEEAEAFSAGIRELHVQIGTSRLIVARLVAGQHYKDLEFIKGELNPVITNIIQQKCLPKDVPYLTA